MGKVCSIAILLIVGIAVFYFVGDNKSPTAFFNGIISFAKKILFQKPAKKRSGAREPEKWNDPFDRVHTKRSSDGKGLNVTGKPATSDGVKVDITVFDRENNPIGSKRLTVGSTPILIGRGDDDCGSGQKICLPDVSERPTTSRQHCTLSLVDGVPMLRDCYTREESMRDGKPKHSMSFVDGEYVGNGLPIRRSVRVDIGDYTLLLEPAFKVSVPTFGAASAPTGVPTFGADSDDISNALYLDTPTKPYHFGKRG